MSLSLLEKTGHACASAFGQDAVSALLEQIHLRLGFVLLGQVMNGRAGFAFQQFVDLSYVWAYNGTALVNTVLRTTDNNTNPVRLWPLPAAVDDALPHINIPRLCIPSRPASLSPFNQR